MLVSSGHIPISCKNTDRKINIKSGIDKLSTISTDNNFSIICNILNICTLSCSVNSFIYLIMAFDFKTAYSPTLKIKAGVLLSPFFLHFSSSNFHIYNCSICNSKSLLLFSLVILITYPPMEILKYRFIIKSHYTINLLILKIASPSNGQNKTSKSVVNLEA